MHFAGAVDGVMMLPDDITFAPDGAMFVSDTRGMDGPGGETPGRVVRVDPDGTATTVAVDLPSPNGIVFDEKDEGLWVASTTPTASTTSLSTRPARVWSRPTRPPTSTGASVGSTRRRSTPRATSIRRSTSARRSSCSRRRGSRSDASGSPATVSSRPRTSRSRREPPTDISSSAARRADSCTRSRRTEKGIRQWNGG